jgi:hypothetical protein
MAEEKQTDYIDDTLTQDDTDVLREVLESEHARGISPVSTYSEGSFSTDVE